MLCYQMKITLKNTEDGQCKASITLGMRRMVLNLSNNGMISWKFNQLRESHELISYDKNCNSSYSSQQFQLTSKDLLMCHVTTIF